MHWQLESTDCRSTSARYSIYQPHKAFMSSEEHVSIMSKSITMSGSGKHHLLDPGAVSGCSACMSAMSDSHELRVHWPAVLRTVMNISQGAASDMLSISAVCAGSQQPQAFTLQGESAALYTTPLGVHSSWAGLVSSQIGIISFLKHVPMA